MAKTAPAPPKKKSPLANAAGGQIQRAAQAELDPVIAALTAAANQRAKASEAAITGYTDAYANQLGGIDAAAPYGSAITGQASVDAALRQALAGGGADLASQLSSRLAALQGSSGAGALAQEAGALGSQGESAGNTRLASGSAGLTRLIADQAGARSYSEKLPGLARLSGLQGIKQAEGNAQQDIAQGTQQIEANLPTVVNELRSARQQARALKSENAYRQAEIGLSAQRNQISARRAQISAAQGQERINIEAQRAAQSALSSNRNYRLSLSRLGVEQKRLQLSWMTSEAKLKGGGYTPNELRNLQLTANQIAQGASKHQASLQQLMHTMALNDIPPSVAFKAAKLVGYKPGAPGMFSGLAKELTRPFDAAGSAVTTVAQKTILGLAHKFIGTPYVWGGESPKGFDCSGFAQYLYARAGISIPRTTYTQWQTGHAIGRGQLAPGDLVFFKGSDSRGGLPGHVGVYIGGGKMIDAPHTGADVRVESVDGFPGYMGARRYGKG